MTSEIFSQNALLWVFIWQSTICIAAGLAASFALRRRPAWAHQVLLLALLAAVIVPVMSILIKHYELGVFVAEPAMVKSEVKGSIKTNRYERPAAIVTEDAEQRPALVEEHSPSAVINSERAEFPWNMALLWGWIVTSLVLTLRLLITFIQGMRFLSQSAPLHCQRIEQAAHLARVKLAMAKEVKICSSENIRSPVIWCWGSRPVLLVPLVVERSDTTVDWVSVLCHELAHYKRIDHISGLLAELVVCILPWNPLIWWAKSRLVGLSEQACDDWVVASGQQSTDYAESLLDLRPQRQMAFTPAVVSSKKGLAGRVCRILQDRCGNPRISLCWTLLVGVMAVCVTVGIAFAQTRPATVQAPEERIVHFPQDRTLGQLFIQDTDTKRQTDTTFYQVNDYDGWEYFGQARGDVVVPAGKRLKLIIARDAWKNLSPLSRLRADDLYALIIAWGIPNTMSPDDRCMRNIANLTGLKYLSLGRTNISSEGLKNIRNFKSLEYLELPEKVSDEGMVYIAQLPSLKGLYFRENMVTNSGLRHLAKLTTLEELDLRGGRIGDAGLVHLAKLPRLRYLLLYGDGFSDNGLAHLKNIPSLRILHIGYLRQITDAGLVHLSELDKLENLSLHWNENITDKGIVNLKKMQSLKKLDVSHARLTDDGVAHLKDIKTLEYLNLPHEGITDKGLSYLVELDKLKHLSVPRVHYVDPSMNKEYYTDKGLESLSRCRLLEELTVGSIGITDAGMSHIVKLQNLKVLNLFGCDKVTNEGLAKLTALKSLKNLNLHETQVTVSGLSQLNAMPQLTHLDVYPLIDNGSTLNIAGLTNLEDLDLGFSDHRQPKSTFGDADLACLSGLKNLKRLSIYPCDFSDAGMVHLAGLTNLERLGIGGSGLTDGGLKYLTGLKKLNHLTIDAGFYDVKTNTWGSGGRLTGEGLRHLEKIQSLTYLTINVEGNFSPNALSRLRKNLPNLLSININNNSGGYGGYAGSASAPRTTRPRSTSSVRTRPRRRR